MDRRAYPESQRQGALGALVRLALPSLAVFGMTETDFTESDYWQLLDGHWRTLGNGVRSEYMP